MKAGAALHWKGSADSLIGTKTRLEGSAGIYSTVYRVVYGSCRGSVLEEQRR